MSIPQQPAPAKLFVSVLSASPERIATVLAELAGRYKTLDFVSAVLAFDYTDYYEAEMGKGLVRRFAAFSDLISPDRLSEIKITTNMIEKKLSINEKRTVNIDPGLLSAERVVLATGKNYSHRIYLGGGIYADLTLIYKRGEFLPLEWTYPDYASSEIREMFMVLRGRYIEKVKS